MPRKLMHHVRRAMENLLELHARYDMKRNDVEKKTCRD
jgi:hypothetical protein